MKYLAIGQMSGTSLDGCDWIEVEFEFNESISYRIISAETHAYSDSLSDRLSRARQMSAQELSKLNADYEHFLAESCSRFTAHKSTPDLISLHGHTVFHQPDKGFTTQLGKGTEIVRQMAIEVISDFRSADIALGGQGAPLVPIGDRMLFPEYDACINLGGYANISFEKKDRRVAYDIGPCNFPLNFLAQKTGQSFDEDGQMASKGRVIESLYAAIRQLNYYKKDPPKSIGNEWFDQEMRPLLNNDFSVVDNLATVSTAIADSIVEEIKKNNFNRVLATGGGAWNSFLTERIRSKGCEIFIPDRTTVAYKEALIFALMGVLRKRGQINVLCSATGADRDHSSGIHLVP